MDNTIIERFVGCKMFAKCVCLDYSDGHDRQDETTLTQCPVLTVLGTYVMVCEFIFAVVNL